MLFCGTSKYLENKRGYLIIFPTNLHTAPVKIYSLCKLYVLPLKSRGLKFVCAADTWAFTP